MSTPISGTSSSSQTTSSSNQTTSTQTSSTDIAHQLAQQGPPISFGGLVSGINTTQVVQALLAAQEAPILQLQDNEAHEQLRLLAWQDLNTKLSTLQTKASTLGLQSTIGSKLLAFGGPAGTFATGVAKATAASGSFQLQIDQLATATKVTSRTGIGSAITASDIATIGSKLATPVTAGSFTVNGKSISVVSGASFATILSDINTQTGGAVTGTVVNNTIQLTSNNGQPIMLGSAGDTSNFLSVVKLLGQPAALTMTSSGPVGVANANVALNNANISGLVSTSQGSLNINGVTITYNSLTDTLNDVLSKINASAAGVTATYDPNSDTVTFTSAKTGNIDVSMADGTGTLLSSLNVLTATTSSSHLGAPIVGTDVATTTNKLPTPVSAGTFTVNGVQVTVNAGDTFNTILSAIGTATGGAVTGAVVGDAIQLTGQNGQLVTLGAAGDTSNFLSVTKLAGQPAATAITSSGLVGVANNNAILDNGNLNGLQSTTTGALVVNGVTINYNTTTDTLAAVLQRINSSSAGVTAFYDATSDKVSISSNSGNLTLSDTTGNLVSVLNVAASVASAHHIGTSAKYEVNGGPAQFSLSNTVNDLVPGVNVTLEAVTPTGSPITGTVSLDPSVATKAIQDFVDAYNAVVDLIQKDTAYDPNTKVAGIFLGEATVGTIQEQLDDGLFRSDGAQLGLTAPYQDVSTIGLSTGAIGSAPGTTTHLQLDSDKLAAALNDNTAAVTSLATTVFGKLSAQLLSITAPFGPVDSAIQAENTQIADLQTEIDNQNRLLQLQQDALTQQYQGLDQILASLQSQSQTGASVLASLAGSTATSSSTGTGTGTGA